MSEHARCRKCRRFRNVVSMRKEGRVVIVKFDCGHSGKMYESSLRDGKVESAYSL